MSTSVTPPTEAKEFDPKAHFAARNEADHAARNGKEAPAKPVEQVSADGGPAPAEQPQPHIPRSARREMNRYREQAAEERGRRLAMEELMARGVVAPAQPKAAEDPEPQRANFATDAEFQRALGRWDMRQEVKALESKGSAKQQQEQELAGLRAEIDAAEEQAQTDIKELFPDWDEVSKAASENEDAPEFIPADHPMLMMLIARSDVKARVLYHFAKEPEALENILALSKNTDKQIAAFHRLEGKVEKLYDKSKAAQAAGDKPSKDRTIPEKAEQAMGAAERDARKPKPSAEVAARGGSAPPEEPEIGSAAWMARRNQATGGR